MTMALEGHVLMGQQVAMLGTKSALNLPGGGEGNLQGVGRIGSARLCVAGGLGIGQGRQRMQEWKGISRPCPGLKGQAQLQCEIWTFR